MSSKTYRYQILQPSDEAANNPECGPEKPFAGVRYTSCRTVSRWTNATIVGLVLTNLCMASIIAMLIWYQRLGFSSESNDIVPFIVQDTEPVTEAMHPEESLRAIDLPTEYAKFKWWTAWGMEAGATNDSNLPSAHVADELWNGVRPDHGLVAVDRDWAREQNWPESMYLPKDTHGREKSVYLLEAYHQIHCLKIIRLSFVESRRGIPLTWPVGHTTHCFDALRQSIQCNADTTPLYTFGDMTAGDGQVRKCKSWGTLRDWATEHSACYRDSVEHIPLRDHFGFCQPNQPYQGGRDGLP